MKTIAVFDFMGDCFFSFLRKRQPYGELLSILVLAYNVTPLLFIRYYKITLHFEDQSHLRAAVRSFVISLSRANACNVAMLKIRSKCTRKQDRRSIRLSSKESTDSY